jgi:hypothetical protein
MQKDRRPLGACPSNRNGRIFLPLNARTQPNLDALSPLGRYFGAKLGMMLVTTITDPRS